MPWVFEIDESRNRDRMRDAVSVKSVKSAPLIELYSATHISYRYRATLLAGWLRAVCSTYRNNVQNADCTSHEHRPAGPAAVSTAAREPAHRRTAYPPRPHPAVSRERKSNRLVPPPSPFGVVGRRVGLRSPWSWPSHSEKMRGRGGLAAIHCSSALQCSRAVKTAATPTNHACARKPVQHHNPEPNPPKPVQHHNPEPTHSHPQTRAQPGRPRSPAVAGGLRAAPPPPDPRLLREARAGRLAPRLEPRGRRRRRRRHSRGAAPAVPLPDGRSPRRLAQAGRARHEPGRRDGHRPRRVRRAADQVTRGAISAAWTHPAPCKRTLAPAQPEAAPPRALCVQLA